MRWWNREVSRQLLSAVAAILGLFVPGGPLLRSLSAWDIGALVYLLLTWLAYHRREPAELRTMALATRRRRWTDRLLVTTPEQNAQGAAAVAMVVTVVAMPQAERLGVAPAVAFTICGLAVVTSWLTLQAGFSI